MGHLVAVEARELSQEAITTLLHAKDLQAPAIVDHFYYPRLVDAVEEQLIVNQAPFVRGTDGESRDYRVMFDQTRRSDLFSTPAKDYLLTKQIHRIYSTFALEDFRKYYQIYEKEVRDQDLLARSYNDFSLEFNSSRQDITSVALLEESGAKAKLEQVLEKHAGKIVYVDFWASWCMPCRAAMKASQELRQSLSKEKVVFVYLSIDDNKTSWQKASVKEKLSDYPENYLIVNPRTSAFLKKAKLEAIPRYMIFDKSGRLMYPNAPRVEGKDIDLLLTQLARKP
ncbi:TlpA disulfide reductase family protein [Siphonobacter sp. SORGH_AS_0500]|uniref:TlpA family protein disulfide reductase n=1 Tax=Siphonobacter sp. SORGH_AS_0500 TaxID=1864824 RepID=UPI00286D2B7D|nr:TlpA disulfide reductase family protein [Siphonobacter sp. SORGH_AS_0500]